MVTKVFSFTKGDSQSQATAIKKSLVTAMLLEGIAQNKRAAVLECLKAVFLRNKVSEDKVAQIFSTYETINPSLILDTEIESIAVAIHGEIHEIYNYLRSDGFNLIVTDGGIETSYKDLADPATKKSKNLPTLKIEVKDAVVIAVVSDVAPVAVLGLSSVSSVSPTSLHMAPVAAATKINTTSTTPPTTSPHIASKPHAPSAPVTATKDLGYADFQTFILDKYKTPDRFDAKVDTADLDNVKIYHASKEIATVSKADAVTPDFTPIAKITAAPGQEASSAEFTLLSFKEFTNTNPPPAGSKYKANFTSYDNDAKAKDFVIGFTKVFMTGTKVDCEIDMNFDEDSRSAIMNILNTSSDKQFEAIKNWLNNDLKTAAETPSEPTADIRDSSTSIDSTATMPELDYPDEQDSDDTVQGTRKPSFDLSSIASPKQLETGHAQKIPEENNKQTLSTQIKNILGPKGKGKVVINPASPEDVDGATTRRSVSPSTSIFDSGSTKVEQLGLISRTVGAIKNLFRWGRRDQDLASGIDIPIGPPIITPPPTVKPQINMALQKELQAELLKRAITSEPEAQTEPTPPPLPPRPTTKQYPGTMPVPFPTNDEGPPPLPPRPNQTSAEEKARQQRIAAAQARQNQQSDANANVVNPDVKPAATKTPPTFEKELKEKMEAFQKRYPKQ